MATRPREQARAPRRAGWRRNDRLASLHHGRRPLLPPSRTPQTRRSCPTFLLCPASTAPLFWRTLRAPWRPLREQLTRQASRARVSAAGECGARGPLLLRGGGAFRTGAKVALAVGAAAAVAAAAMASGISFRRALRPSTRASCWTRTRATGSPCASRTRAWRGSSAPTMTALWWARSGTGRACGSRCIRCLASCSSAAPCGITSSRRRGLQKWKPTKD
mmetsp:Transcript_4035/g.12949  ORF Transcript_4035/g.12949 Transcript_4035/m.12949 type:complete len:219 (+) Transcript_4035:326-982(+)